VIDAVETGLLAIAGGSAWAYPLVFGAGIATSIGPCVAPRYIAVAALAASARHPRRVLAAFATGIIAAYVAIGSAAGLTGALRAWSPLVYAMLAAALITAGAFALIRGAAPFHAHHARLPVSVGGTLLLGAASAVVISPCCTPIVAGIAGLTMVSGRPVEGVALLACFAAGHVVPAILAAACGTRGRAIFTRAAGTAASNVVSGTLMLALGTFYGLLA
jgi:cytochrome c biogenesis protein CcdA